MWLMCILIITKYEYCVCNATYALAAARRSPTFFQFTTFQTSCISRLILAAALPLRDESG